jgi:hypothetical protein
MPLKHPPPLAKLNALACQQDIDAQCTHLDERLELPPVAASGAHQQEALALCVGARAPRAPRHLLVLCRGDEVEGGVKGLEGVLDDHAPRGEVDAVGERGRGAQHDDDACACV